MVNDLWDQSRNRWADAARCVAHELDEQGNHEAAEGFRAEARSWRAGKAESDPRAQAYRDDFASQCLERYGITNDRERN